ncbi:fibronectin type III domain-containing protein [Citrifermentans bremense]|uniref:fibronectin type III domain-containing protein n=1 Tax=Citrifermentans bremense TaxID=60035 RepID=UPI0012EB4905|nr:fibronectin type III domain-containing protein [Citrifermentans bremense]
MKTSLVLLFTLVTSVFMYQGWYKPMQLQAATVSYYPTMNTTTNLGADGTCNVIGVSPYTSSGIGRTTAATTEGSTAYRYYPTISSANTATVAFKVYGPVYANAVNISGISVTSALRGLATSDTVKLDLYDYDPAGALDNGTLVASSAAKTLTGGGNTTQYSWTPANFTINGTGRVAQGHRLQLRFTWTSSVTGTPRVYFGLAGSLSSTSFTVTETNAVANPTVTAASPALQQGASGTVTVTGTGFNAVQSVAFSGTGVTAGTPTTVNATTVTVPVTVADNSTVGTRDVTVTNTDGGVGTGTGLFTVSPAPTPTVTSTSPAFMKQGDGPTTVTITGTNFQSGSTVAFSGTGITLGAVSYVDASALTVPVTVAAGATLGGRDVTVTLPGGVTGTGTAVFTVNSPCAAGQPTGLTHGAETATSVPLTWTPGANTNYSIVFRDGVQIATNVLTGSYTDNTASPGTSYNYTVTGYNTAGSCQSVPSAATTAVTLAQAPVAPAVANVGTGTELTVAVNPDANSATTQYAIRINGGAYANQYVQSGGTVGAAAAWNTLSGWGVKTISGLTSGTPYTFDVKARNSALVETAFGPSSTVTPKIALSSSITNCGGCHGNPPADGTGRNVPAGQFKGSHAKHTSILTCANCHKDNGVSPAGNKHSDGNIDIANPLRQVAGESYGQATHPVSDTPAFASCTTYCHSQGTGKTSQTGETRTALSAPVTALVWGTGSSTCGSCHGAPPAYANGATTWGAAKANAHQGATHASKTCDVCHTSVTYAAGVYTPNAQHLNGTYNIQASFGYTYAATGGTCATSGCHVSIAWNGKLGCVDCHGAVINTSAATQALGGPTTRRNVVQEMKSAWSHKRSSNGGTPANTVVNDADCIVCHMEGAKATGKTTTAHGNGYINLRDPDTGLNIKNVTWNGATPGQYVEGTTDVQFLQYQRDLTKTLETDPNWLVIAAIQQNHCLKCHDGLGAVSTEAQVPTTGTAMRPFGIAITNHVAPYNSNGLGNVVNVAAGLATTNASYHPVIGKQNNSYVQGAQMVAPYATITKTNGNNTSWGALMSCWDCHATLAQTGVQTFTVTAHGNAVTLRGPIRAAGTTASTNLCVNCHATKYATTASQHGAGSAFTQGAGDMGTATFNNCSYCHGYGVVAATYSATSVGRPLRAEEGHGFNDRVAGTVGSKWSNGNRPYAFIRNTLSGWAPKSAVGDTITNPSTCSGTGGTCDNNMGNSTNGLGGVY